MKSHLEVARDAVRSAGLEELADSLEWAAAAVRHRATLLSAARWSASEGGACADCGAGYVHDRECPTANMLHALDPEWSREEVEAAQTGAHFYVRPDRVASDSAEISRMLFAESDAVNAAYERIALRVANSRGDLQATAAPIVGTSFVIASLRDGVTGVVAASPQPAQPQPEDEPADE